jgi:hypothetical protein
LKGIDNGVMDEPPVTVFVRGWQAMLLCLEDAGTWRNEAARRRPACSRQRCTVEWWSVGRHHGEPGADSYAYRPSVRITTGRRGLGSTTPWAMPIDQRLDEGFSLLFTSETLREPLSFWASRSPCCMWSPPPG